jgi:hypothetical protein
MTNKLSLDLRLDLQRAIDCAGLVAVLTLSSGIGHGQGAPAKDIQREQMITETYVKDDGLIMSLRVTTNRLSFGATLNVTCELLRSPLDRLHLCWTPTDSFVNMGAWQRLTDGAWIIKLWNICG